MTIIRGTTGNDIINGGDNNDIINGGLGIDILDGGAGDDYLNGGDGDDTLYGGLGIDILDGGAGNDKLDGGAGDDILDGGAGNDKLDGGIGNDYLDGGIGNDTLYGGAGNDYLEGGAGNDTLNGGAGADYFVFDSYDTGMDTITDFSRSQGDKIQISASGFGFASIEAAKASIAFANPKMPDSTPYFFRHINKGILYFDSNGSADGGLKEVALLGIHHYNILSVSGFNVKTDIVVVA